MKTCTALFCPGSAAPLFCWCWPISFCNRQIMVKSKRSGWGKPVIHLATPSFPSGWQWKRAPGPWRPRRSPPIKVALSSKTAGWRAVEGRGRGWRWRICRVWRKKRCQVCGEIKYVWSQVCIQVAHRRLGGGWTVRSTKISHPLKADSPIDWEPEPSIRCSCPGLRGPRRVGYRREEGEGFPLSVPK